MNLETALVIPVTGLPPVIEDVRLRLDPSARAGVPAHVTIVYPFLEPALVHTQRLAELETVFGGFVGFEYSLVALRNFDDGTAYLAPEPERPFIAMCEAVGARFGVAPYRGAYTEVVPHLTLAQAAGEAERRKVEEEIASLLPLRASATMVWLLAGRTDTAWRLWRAFELGT